MHLNKCVLQIYMHIFLESESCSPSNNMKFDNNTRAVFLACNCFIFDAQPFGSQYLLFHFNTRFT